MTAIFKFGEDHPDYPVSVVNEREARGAAGILFLFALIAFMNAWFKGDFTPTKLVIVAFFIDFFIRVVVNPRYSPDGQSKFPHLWPPQIPPGKTVRIMTTRG